MTAFDKKRSFPLFFYVLTFPALDLTYIRLLLANNECNEHCGRDLIMRGETTLSHAIIE